MTRASRAIVAALSVVAAVAATACERSTSTDRVADHQTDRVTTLGVPDRINQTPGVAAEGAFVVVSWVAIGADSIADAYVAASQDAGATFGPPVRVNDVPGEVRPSEQQAPRIAIHNGTVAVLWTSRRGSETQVQVAVSRDQGRSFAAPQAISPSGASGTRGWGSLLIDDQRQIHALWLDTRVSASSTAPMKSGDDAGQHVHGGAAKAETRQDVYEATIAADGHVSERLIATGVCFCCKTALAQQGGAVWGAWRDVYPGSLRDISIAKLTPSSVSRVRVSEDHWKIDGCPEDGPALAAGGAGPINIVWPTLVASEPMTKGVFHATSSDGQTFSERFRLDDGAGSASHPAVSVLASGTVLAVWEVTAGQEHRIDMRQRQGAAWQPVTPLTRGASASSPSVAGVAQGFVVAWGRKNLTGDASIIEVRHVPATR